MKRLITLCVLFLIALNKAYSAAPELLIETKPQPQINYAWISFIASGPASWFSDSKVRGRYLRFVVYGPVEEYPSTFRIETITYGDETCCRKLNQARGFELPPSMAENFGPFSVDAPEFEFLRWANSTSAVIKYRGKQFVLRDLDKNTIRLLPDNTSK